MSGLNDDDKKGWGLSGHHAPMRIAIDKFGNGLTRRREPDQSGKCEPAIQRRPITSRGQGAAVATHRFLG